MNNLRNNIRHIILSLIFVFLFCAGCGPQDNRPLTKHQIEQIEKREEERFFYRATQIAIEDGTYFELIVDRLDYNKKNAGSRLGCDME